MIAQSCPLSLKSTSSPFVSGLRHLEKLFPLLLLLAMPSTMRRNSRTLPIMALLGTSRTTGAGNARNLGGPNNGQVSQQGGVSSQKSSSGLRLFCGNANGWKSAIGLPLILSAVRCGPRLNFNLSWHLAASAGANGNEFNRLVIKTSVCPPHLDRGAISSCRVHLAKGISTGDGSGICRDSSIA